MRYNFKDITESMNQDFEDNRKYTATIKAEVKNERVSLRLDSTSMRTKIMINISYEIIDNATNKKITNSNIIQIDSIPVAESPFADFTSSETVAIQLMKEALDELRNRLIIFALEQKKM